jgi:hypothetical protein
MRTPCFFFGVISLASTLLMNGQTIEVTSTTLAGWTVTGADQSALQASPSLTLPAGSQISRVFQAGDLAVDAVTQPVLGTESQDWPMLELGPAALVFARKGDSGQLILALAGDDPVALPLTIALDAEGRSTEPVAVSLALSGGVLTVSSGGQSWRFPVAPGVSTAQEVVASAGVEHAWAFETLQVSGAALTVVGTGGSGAGSGAKPPSPEDSGSAGSRQGTTASRRVFVVESFAATASAPLATPSAQTGPPKTLEVFTPPSVRHGRADAVRATLSQSKNQ